MLIASHCIHRRSKAAPWKDAKIGVLMERTSMSRRKFLGIAGAAGTLSAFALVGCGGSSNTNESAAVAPATDGSAGSYGEGLKLPTPIPEAADAVWKVDYVNDELSDDFVHDNWRMSIDEFEDVDKITILKDLGLSTNVSRSGMETLQTMGGADFTANQFDWILAQAKERAGVSADKIIVMDLRGESHGLIDGNVFMRWIPNNCVNESIPTEEVIEIEAKLLSDLKAMDIVEMYETNDKWEANFEKPMMSFEKPEIITEEDLVTSKGCKYVRFADTNHFRPDDHEVDLLVDFMPTVADDEWLFMHCYAGEGRTTCFMVLVDIIKNYKVANFDDIAARQGLIGPVDVRTEVITTKKSHYKKKASIERRVFLQMFYNYCAATDFSISWTEWARDLGYALDYYPLKQA